MPPFRTPETVLCLHGFTGHPTDFKPLIQHFGISAIRWRLPFLPGHGERPVSPARGPFDEVVSDWFKQEIESGVDGTSPPWLLGYSMGGRLALSLALRNPGQFGGLILIGAHPGLSSKTERENRRLQDQKWIRCLREEGLAHFLGLWQAQDLIRSQRARLDSSFANEWARARKSHQADSLADSLEILGTGQMPDYRSHLKNLTLPVLLIHGEEDVKFAALHREMLKRLPQGHLLEISGSGHAVHLENPLALASRLKQEWMIPL